MTTAKKDWRTYIPVLVWTILIIFLSTGASIELPPSWWEFAGIDKIGHCSFYVIHTFLLLWTFTKNSIFKEKKRRFVAVLLSILLGIFLEIVQFSFYPNRYFEVLDIIANISGSFIGMALFNKFYKYIR